MLISILILWVGVNIALPLYIHHRRKQARMKRTDRSMRVWVINEGRWYK